MSGKVSVFARLTQCASVFLLSAATAGADQTWVGSPGATNDWSEGSNWNGGVVPSNTVALVTNGAVAVIGADIPRVTSIYAGCSLTRSGAAGSVLQTNGTVLVAGGTYPLLIGFNTRANAGTYDLGGGTLTVTGNVFVGSSESPAPADQSYGTGLLRVRGTGVMNYSGSQFYVAHNGRTGTVEVADGGSLTLRGSTMRLGEGGAVNVGTLTVSGGTFSAPGLETALAGGRASVNVSGGSLWLDGLTVGSGTADIRLSGGTLGAQANNAVWSAPMALTDGTVTFYTGDPSGTARVNTASGVLSGSGSLVITTAPGQTVPGTLALGADNTFTGGSTLEGDNTLQFGAGGTAGWLSGPITVASGGSLAFGRSDVVTNNLVFSGTPTAIIQNGSGTLVLTNEAPVYDAAVVNAGVLRFSEPLAIPSAGPSVTVNRGGALAGDGAYGTVTDWLNSGRIVTSSAGALALTADSGEYLDLTVAGGGLYTNLSLGASGEVSYSGTLTPIGGVRRLGGGNGTLTYATPITGGSVLIDGGAGTVVLGTANMFGGGVTVHSGTLRVGDPNGLGSGLVTVSGGVLQVNTNLAASGGVWVTNTGMAQVGAGGTLPGIVSNDAVNVSAGTTAGLVFNGSCSFTHAGDIAGSGGLAVIGGGTLALYTPGQTVSQARLLVGNNGSAGNLELSAGTLNMSDGLIVACGTKAGTPSSAFTFSGGTINKSGANGTLVGDINGSVGAMTMREPAVYNAAGGPFVVSTGSGTGTLTVNGGLLNQTSGDFIVANSNGRGTVNLYGGVVSNSAGKVYVGYGAGGAGSLTMTGGVLYCKNNLNVGQLAGASGTLNLSNGTVTAGALVVGQTGTGTVIQTGGALTRVSGNDWRLGDTASSLGRYTLYDGVLDSGSTGFLVGGSGQGTLFQAGGVFNCGGWPCVGRYPGGAGVYTLAGGTFNQTGPLFGLIVGEQGTGTFIVTDAGAANISGSFGLVIGHSTGTGTVTLARGGLIGTRLCQKLAGTSRATFNFDGGTLLARTNGATIANYLQGLTETYVKAGGAFIDTSNNTVTVAQNLQSGASPDGGLTKLGRGLLILSGTNSYNGTTTVSNGILLLGVANAITNTGAIRVAGGILDLGGFAVTNGAVTLDTGAIVNGLLSVSSFTGTDAGNVAIRLSGTGGLTKSGDGTLTLLVAQAYTGPTLVSGGLLKLAPPVQDALIHYDFDSANISGSTVLNFGTGGAAYNGVINGAVSTGVSGRFGQAVSIGGSGQGVVTANIVTLTNAFTFATWVKSAGTSSQYQRIINNAYATGGYLGTDSANKFLTIIKNKTFVSSSQSSADTAAWHHLALVWDGLNVTLYYDGTAIQTKTYTGTDASLVSKIAFGNNTVPNDEFWNGAMDDAFVFGRALTGSEVAGLFTGSGSWPSTNLLPAATSLQLANGAALDLGGTVQTVASLSGSGAVSNGSLTVTGLIEPGGTDAVGTLSLPSAPILSGKLLADVAADSCDLLDIRGSVDVSNLSLELANPEALNRQVARYVIITCAPGGLSGTFALTQNVPVSWHVRYYEAAGEVRLVYQRGTMMRLR